MKSTRSYRTGMANIDRTLSEISRDINELFDSVNPPQTSVGYGVAGKSGDIRLTFDDNGYAYLEGKGNEGWLTTFTGVMTDKPARGRPLPRFPVLEVDNLYARMFTVAQTTARNGNELMSDFGIVESFTNTTIIFKDQSNLNLCAFAAGDTCEVRSIKANKSANIKKINFTVNSVSGRTCTVTYSATDLVSIGDIVVRIGNTTTAARQKAIYFSTADNTNVPYIDLYAGTTGYTFGTPKASFGDMTHIADSDFNSVSPYFLTGDGIYCTNAYIKGKIVMTNQGSISIAGFNNDAGFITSAAIPPIPESFYQSSEPTTMITGDFWFDTSTAGQYKMKRYNGTSWATSPVVSVYMDANGVYAGSITAGQVTSGTFTVGIQNSINTSNLTNGAGFITAATAGAASFYGTTEPTVAGNGLKIGDFWFDTNTGVYKMKRCTAITPSVTWANVSVYMDANGVYAGNITAGQITAGTLTGFTIQTTVSNPRIVIDGSTNKLTFYDVYGNASSLYTTATANQIFCDKTIVTALDLRAYDIIASNYIWNGNSRLSGNASLSYFIFPAEGTSIYPATIATQAWVSSLGVISYPSAGIALSTGSAWGTSITNNSANWNTAYSWGNHASAGYLTSYTETDPTIYAWAKAAAKPAYTYSEVGAASTTDARLSDARIASDVYAWAKAATKPSYTAAEVGAVQSNLYGISPIIYDNVANSIGLNSTSQNNWNTAYGWGNHASAGYLTNLSSLDPSKVSQTASYRFVTDTEKSTWNAKATASWGSGSAGSPSQLMALTINGTTYNVGIYLP